jgi:hypothetical protein
MVAWVLFSTLTFAINILNVVAGLVLSQTKVGLVLSQTKVGLVCSHAS